MIRKIIAMFALVILSLTVYAAFFLFIIKGGSFLAQFPDDVNCNEIENKMSRFSHTYYEELVIEQSKLVESGRPNHFYQCYCKGHWNDSDYKTLFKQSDICSYYN